MAYNNYYAGYNNPYYMPNTMPIQENIPQAPNTQPATTTANYNQNSNIIWIQGENSAKSYIVARNTNVLLMDSEAQRFYIKSADVSGMPLPLRVFEYKEVGTDNMNTENVNTPMPNIDLSNYVTKEEFTKALEQIKPVEKTNTKTTKGEK